MFCVLLIGVSISDFRSLFQIWDFTHFKLVLPFTNVSVCIWRYWYAAVNALWSIQVINRAPDLADDSRTSATCCVHPIQLVLAFSGLNWSSDQIKFLPAISNAFITSIQHSLGQWRKSSGTINSNHSLYGLLKSLSQILFEKEVLAVLFLLRLTRK